MGHPRALPAKEKQIHYFKYYLQKGLGWYYSHFPTAEFFLSSGALITGEASPGYLPYPDVAKHIRTTLPNTKLILVAREPIDRAWSSYKYSYLTPALKSLRAGTSTLPSGNRVPAGQSEEYYMEHHITPFEDFIRIELDTLARCLRPGGAAETRAKKYTWAGAERERRAAAGLPPLADVIDACYDNQRLTRAVPRSQWKELAAAHPNRTLDMGNPLVISEMVGRGLYALQAEWYYATGSRAENGVLCVCTEDMGARPEETLDSVTAALGLPPFDYAAVVGVGKYNSAGHEGYDTATPWSEDGEGEDELDKEDAAPIPLSPGTLKELKKLYDEHNERLFRLVGHRCDW